MPTYTITGPDGRDYSIDGPEGATPEQVVSAIKSQLLQSQSEPEPLDTPRQRVTDAAGQIKDEVMSGSLKAIPAVGVLEAGANLASGIASSAVGGIAGLGRMAVEGYRNQVDKGLHMPTREEFDAAAANAASTSGAIQGAATYQPRSGYGKLVTEAVMSPLMAAKQAGHEIGGDVGQLINGDQGRLAGESIGEITPDIAATLLGGRAAMRGAQKFANRPAAEPMPGRDYTPIREQTAAEAQRMQEMTSQEIRPTLGQVTRNPEQFRFEDQQGKTQEGAALRTRELDTNDALVKAIEDTDKSISGRGNAENVRVAGELTREAMADRATRAMQKVKKEYTIARESGETRAIVDTSALEKFLDESRAESIAVPALRAIDQKLQFLKEENGGRLTINDVETLYKSAGKLQQVDASAGHFMREVKNLINQATEGVGGDLYRQARQSRLSYGLEFEDSGAIARLIDKKPGSRTDFKTASEDVFNKTVVNSSLAELKAVVNSFLSDDPIASPKSFQAVRELQAQTINYLIKKSTEKGITNERGAQGLSAPSLRNAVEAIETEKLNFLLGEDAVKRIQTTVENAKNVKQSPGRVSGSDTSINLRDAAKSIGMHEAFRHLGKIIPGTAKIADFLDRRAAARETQARITQSLNPRMPAPEQIMAAIAEYNAQRRAANMAALRSAAGDMRPAAIYATAAQNRQNEQNIRNPIANTRVPVVAPFLITKRQADQQRHDQAMRDLGSASSVDEAIEAANRAVN